MKNKIIAFTICFAFSLGMVGCGNSSANQEVVEKSLTSEVEVSSVVEVEESAVSEVVENPMVDCIDLTVDGGSLKYVGIEKADEGLTDEENAYVIKYEYTNNKSQPTQAQNDFNFSYFQNGVQIIQGLSWNSIGEQSSLLEAYFGQVMQGATSTIGFLVAPSDNSTLTICIADAANPDNYQMMEVDLSSVSGGEESTGTSDVSAEEIEASLQGTWTVGDGSFYFENGNVTSGPLSGTYVINTENSTIDATFQATDGNVNISLPYTYENGILSIYNNNNEEMVKQ